MRPDVTREQLLSGVATVNQEEVDARNDKQEAEAASRAEMERGHPEPEDVAAGDTGARLPADTRIVPRPQEGLEAMLKSQVTGLRQARGALESAITTHKQRLDRLFRGHNDVCRDLKVAEGILETEYGDKDKNAVLVVPSGDTAQSGGKPVRVVRKRTRKKKK